MLTFSMEAHFATLGSYCKINMTLEDKWLFQCPAIIKLEIFCRTLYIYGTRQFSWKKTLTEMISFDSDPRLLPAAMASFSRMNTVRRLQQSKTHHGAQHQMSMCYQRRSTGSQGELGS